MTLPGISALARTTTRIDVLQRANMCNFFNHYANYYSYVIDSIVCCVVHVSTFRCINHVVRASDVTLCRVLFLGVVVVQCAWRNIELAHS